MTSFRITATTSCNRCGRDIVFTASGPDDDPTYTAPVTCDECSTDRRSPECVEAWPDCAPGEYNPACCRFPKSCSCEVPELDES